MSDSQTLRIRGEHMRRIRETAQRWRRPVIETVHRLLERALRDTDAGLVCRKCGCTEWDACVSDLGEACGWAEPELCTACSLGEHLGPGLRSDHLEPEQ